MENQISAKKRIFSRHKKGTSINGKPKKKGNRNIIKNRKKKLKDIKNANQTSMDA